MKKLLPTMLVVCAVALAIYWTQLSPAQTTSTMMNLESNQVVTGEKSFVNFLGLPTCNGTPPTGSCTNDDICFDTLGGLHTCPAGAWLQPVGGLTEADIIGTVRTFTAKQSFGGGTDFTSISKQNTLFVGDAPDFTCAKSSSTFAYGSMNLGGYFLCDDGDPLSAGEHHAVGSNMKGINIFNGNLQVSGLTVLRHPTSMSISLSRDYFDPNIPASDGQCPSEAPAATACSPNGDFCDAPVNTALYECASGFWRIHEAVSISSIMDTNRGYVDRGGCTTQFRDRSGSGDICWDNTHKTMWWKVSTGDDISIPVAIPAAGPRVTTEDGLVLDTSTQLLLRANSLSVNFQSEEFDFTCGDLDGISQSDCQFDTPIKIGLKKFLRGSMADGAILRPALNGRGTLADVTFSSLIGARPDFGEDCAFTGVNCGTSLWLYYRPMKTDSLPTTWGDVTGDGEMEDALYMNRGIVFTGIDIVPDYFIASPAAYSDDPWLDPNTPFTYADNFFETWFFPQDPVQDAIVTLPNETGTIALRNEMFVDKLILVPDSGDAFLWFRAPYDLTITRIDCLAIGGTSILLDIREADANGASSATILSSTPACLSGTNVTATINDGGIDAGDYVEWNFGTEVGTVTAITLTMQYTKDD